MSPQAADALDAELRASKGVLRRREEQLAAVTSAARQQAEGAHSALAESQRRVERLEGLAAALRDSLGARGRHLGLEQRRELVGQFQELREQLEAAQVGGVGGEQRGLGAAIMLVKT